MKHLVDTRPRMDETGCDEEYREVGVGDGA